MPDALPMTGLFGKVPAHGDFVRRGLPTSFVGPWDAWLQDGMAAARDRLGARWAEVWDRAPPWRFALPAGACGPDAVAGVLLPSEDMVGRRFPITLAALLATGEDVPAPAWFAALEAAAQAGRAGRADADALAAAIPVPGTEAAEVTEAEAPPFPMAVAPLSIDGDAMMARVDDEPMALFTATPEAPDAFGPTPPSDGAPDLLDIFSNGSWDVKPVVPEASEGGDVTSSGGSDVLGLLGSGPPAPESVTSDGTLAFLLGEVDASHTSSDGAAALLPGGASDLDDPLAALIAAGDAPLEAAVSAPPPDVPALIPDDFDPLPAPALAFAPMVPAAPSGGGWWTGGGAWRPPATLLLPALLPAAEFASLLEADA